MHNYKSYKSYDRKSMENHFIGMLAETDPGERDPYRCQNVVFLNKEFSNENEAIEYVEHQAYWCYDTSAVAVKVTRGGKKTKSLTNAEKRYAERKKDYEEFNKNLNIGYGRKSKTVKCPDCESAISISHAIYHLGKGTKCCPVCGSKKVISDSNWETLKRKKRLMDEASASLAEEEKKSNSYWVGCFAWHS